LLLQTFDAMENGMYFDLSSYENVIAIFGLALIIIFALAAFLDSRWRKPEPHRDFGSDYKPNCAPEGDRSDDTSRTSGLYARYADLSARGLGTAEQQIIFRGETQQNLEGD
jgi:hypothetical protein